ncbi:MAG: hypothetical protein ACTHM6_01505 [Tepidisphaeraceae bacterium]
MSAPQTPAPLDLKTQIAAAVAVRWDEFARSHPILAGVIDQTLLVDNVHDSLNNDPQYQEAMAAARAVEAGLETVVKIIDGYVVQFIAKLI